MIERMRRQFRGQTSPSLLSYRFYDFLRFNRSLVGTKHPLTLNTDLSPFFIIGSGRSGTTLMRAILMSGAKVAIPPESYVIPTVIRKFKSMNYLDWADLCRLVISQFESRSDFHTWGVNLAPAYQNAIELKRDRRDLANIINEVYSCYIRQKFPQANTWGDKTPLNTRYVSWIDEVFPKARYVHVLRDGRDVVSSFLRSGLDVDLEQACTNWKNRVKAARSFGSAHDARYLEIRYEDLVSDPQQTISNVCQFLEVPFEGSMLEHEKTQQDLGDVSKFKHLANVGRGISPRSIGNWKNELSATEQAYIARKLGRQLAQMGYA